MAAAGKAFRFTRGLQALDIPPAA